MKERESKIGTREGIADTFRKSTSEMLMLKLLQESLMYVYKMIQELDKHSESTYKITSLYFVDFLYRTEFRKLEEAFAGDSPYFY